MDTKTESLIGRTAIQTQLLIDLMRKAQPGETLTYEHLFDACHENVRPGEDGYPYLLSARKIIKRDYQITFMPVPKVGIMRAGSAECIGLGQACAKSVRRKAENGIRTLGCVVPSELDNAQKIEFNATASQLGAIRAFTGKSAVKKLESAVTESQDRLKLGDTLKAFAKIE